MGAHALGAAAYAAKAAGLAAPDRPEAVSEEICWQLGRMSAAARAGLRQLPPVGENRPVPSDRGFSRQAFSARSSVNSRPAWQTPTNALAPGPQVDQEYGEKEEQPVEVHVTGRLA